MLARIVRGIKSRASREIKNRGYFRKHWYPKYNFEMFPRQLCFLADCLDETKDVEGSIVEVGCAYGVTTTFLYEYMIESGFKKEYMCIDTFSGFTKSDIGVERTERDNVHMWIDGVYKDNNPAWFAERLAERSITDVKIVQSDICTLDPTELPESISFCLLDVDLYQPIKVGLEKLYPRLSPGGIIVVDDCWSKPRHLFVEGIADAYGGALQAYREFTAREGLPDELVEAKLGVIRRPA